MIPNEHFGIGEEKTHTERKKGDVQFCLWSDKEEKRGNGMSCPCPSVVVPHRLHGTRILGILPQENLVLVKFFFKVSHPQLCCK